MATVIDVRETGVTGKFLSDRSFADQSAHESFREKSYVTLLFVDFLLILHNFFFLSR